ncbi:uncharacterized protein UV8b_01882 [Ustilaginoidea virens]|uniref:Uncharacterized protein n=1 Tax=Ustilaginoidea virens TaxID=1159556 RepID=A0A063C091_USTVR|nr:uncharacterized protein UV8b_01882 [Ustilaginoidea virens]QUC17641.1 hypothetical protein UV8b_01882 [Ustilaginoidea virens]GAO14031.1 hypothetical protein UVI_02035800 [Ustilaginoidea virens]
MKRAAQPQRDIQLLIRRVTTALRGHLDNKRPLPYGVLRAKPFGRFVVSGSTIQAAGAGGAGGAASSPKQRLVQRAAWTDVQTLSVPQTDLSAKELGMPKRDNGKSSELQELGCRVAATSALAMI